MTKTFTEIACNDTLEELIAFDKKMEKPTGDRGKLDFYLFELLVNECTLILGNLKSISRAFIEREENVMRELPDVMLINIQAGSDALDRIWKEAITKETPEATPPSVTPGALVVADATGKKIIP